MRIFCGGNRVPLARILTTKTSMSNKSSRFHTMLSYGIKPWDDDYSETAAQIEEGFRQIDAQAARDAAASGGAQKQGGGATGGGGGGGKSSKQYRGNSGGGRK
eukprot:TRINITY_DN15813_c0_g1_i1.p1 TRINITY_DN15813_c0_g1~~TRINITY_DN15813_c0_g1_i1.p1  ORF type:complete len:103 (-),score=22.55 TRINITY_DN15813_c0_g1_i1:108-416(-)